MPAAVTAAAVVAGKKLAVLVVQEVRQAEEKGAPTVGMAELPVASQQELLAVVTEGWAALQPHVAWPAGLRLQLKDGCAH